MCIMASLCALHSALFQLVPVLMIGGFDLESHRLVRGFRWIEEHSIQRATERGELGIYHSELFTGVMINGGDMDTRDPADNLQSINRTSYFNWILGELNRYITDSRSR